ncbi:hypothetical protein OIA45_27130 [Streptomyces chartreusis]|uniref:hypothetical protein n=1 Tax=Streptomyces chartreusis TaxID=1969 RepID=UPI00386A3362|nr:hypothetical protein OIA45_27130 [Streptomyces chartreusis]
MMTTVDLVPGLITTRDAIAAAYGCGTFQGIEPADEAGKVFVYSDPSAGEEYGYTFDGRAEDDEFGPLYLYTGAGANGDQKPSGRNGSLLSHVEKQREVHLFVAHGRVPGGGAMLQRYIGQMVLDPIKPYDVRRGPGKDGVMRNVLVFRFRPAPGTTPAWTEADRLPAATKSDFEITDPLVEVPEPVALPKQSGAKVKKSEQHSTAETIANIPAGQRKVLRREGELVKAFAAHLEAAGHTTHSFQITVKGEPGALTPDLYDATDHALYEAKGQTTRSNIRMAIGQLADYRRHIPGRKELRVVVLLPSEPSDDLKDLLGEEYVELVYQTEEGFAGWPLVCNKP